MSEPLGTKADAGKRHYDLVPWEEFQSVVSVMTHGAVKYAPDNWKIVPDAKKRYFAAALRHILDGWACGERNDPVDKGGDGEPHLAHAICCLLYLMWFDNNHAQESCAESDVATKVKYATDAEMAQLIEALHQQSRSDLENSLLCADVPAFTNVLYYNGHHINAKQFEQLKKEAAKQLLAHNKSARSKK